MLGFLRWLASSEKRKEKKIDYSEFFSCQKCGNKYNEQKQGITNRLALPIEKLLYIYLLCPHQHSKHFHQRNWFT
jgi:hypothetical protein